ncbi:MAG: alpha/beta fold hydrolase [Gemmatimonadota bacterium]|nr:alpha/beta fold hydrolase [Gemmatimonadota bacterium]MDE3215883.1 alpha/beta fold hydrolase [Gemmatimonadota bacterium]
MRGEFVDVGGVRLYYYAAGTRGAGEPLVLIHGFPTSGHLWSEVVPLLPPGHRTVVLDLLGYGRSDRPGAAALGVHAHADRVVALMDALRIGEAALVGHGLGGGVAQSLAVRFPARVSRLALVSSVAFDGWPTRRARLYRGLSPLGRLVPPSWLQSVLRASFLSGYANAAQGAHSLELYARAFAGPDGRDALLRHLRALRADDTAALGPRLGTLRCPTAVVWGGADPFLPAALGERLRDAIPDATLDVLPSARHCVPEDTPAALSAVLTHLLAR